MSPPVVKWEHERWDIQIVPNQVPRTVSQAEAEEAEAEAAELKARRVARDEARKKAWGKLQGPEWVMGAVDPEPPEVSWDGQLLTAGGGVFFSSGRPAGRSMSTSDSIKVVEN